MNTLGAWELPEELRLLQATVRRFMRQEVVPAEQPLAHDAVRLPPDVLERIQAKARAAGLWCFGTPAEYGGAGLNLLGRAVVAEETAQCKMGLYIPGAHAFGWDPPNVIFKGTRAQIEQYALPAVATGAKHFIAITEPAGGSDPGRSIATSAERKGDRYVLNGTKTFISDAGESPWGIVFARTGPAKGRAGISSFIVESAWRGISMRPIPVIRSYFPYEVRFQDCEVPVENRLGEEGQGFTLAQTWLVEQRVPYAAQSIGVAQAALALAIDWAKQRSTFGSALADRQAIQWFIADSEVELRAARLLVYQAAWRGDLGHDIKLDASIAKLYATEVAGRVVDRCVQIFGGLGVARDLPLERWYRELRVRRIGEGPSEIHRMVVARSLLGPSQR